MNKKNKFATNIQRHAFQLTINNPLDYGFDHHTIKEALIMNFTTLKYFCLADEIGEQGTCHTHIYACFSSRVRFSTIKKHFSQAHIEPAFASVQANIDYIRKCGKWEDSEKAETSVEGSYEEWGTVPTQKGNNVDMQELYEMIKAGYSNADILAVNNDYILNIDKLDKVRTTLLIEKYKGTRRLNLKVVYVSGATGLGKTRDILDGHGDANVYRVSDYQHPFDSYHCQPVMCFDEFRSQLRASDMLQYLDIYPIDLPARYSNKYMCAEMIYITSNWKLEKQYPEVQKESPETWEAFLRRIHEVRVYNDDGTVTVYDSTEKYLNRDREFHRDDTEENPFTQAELPFKE